MIKTNVRLSVGLMFLLISLICIPIVAAQSFEPVFKKISEFQNGEAVEIKIQFSSESFTFMRSQSREINQIEFNRLHKDKASQAPLHLKMLSDGGLVVKFEASELFRLEETFKEDKASSWKRIDFVRVGSYPLKAWPTFIRQAISHGLMEYEFMEYKGHTVAFLTFKQTDPVAVKFGKRSLKLSTNFYEYMKISKEFKPRAGNTDKFVILVHEPHWLLAGQYQLIPGLKSLLDTNSQYKFRFLVEGYWEKEIKDILTKPLLNRFSNNISHSTQVYSLLDKFLIDGPLAYRLLHDPNLPATAIDDPELINRTPREPDIKDWTECQSVFEAIVEKLKKIPEDKTTNVIKAFNVLRFYILADAHDLKGQASIDCFLYVSKLFDDLSNKLLSLSKDFTEEGSFLKAQADGYHVQAEICKIALERDGAMSKNIQKHFESEYADRIPIVSIGNFHTPGIIDRLSKGIGYIVVEPRATPLSIAPPKRDKDNFNDALNPASRQSYLKRLAGKRKLNVAPLERELDDYQSFLKKEALRIESQKNQAKTSSPLGALVTSKVITAIKQNPNLNNAIVGFGGGGQVPPIQGAFASFSYGPEGNNPQLLLLDREEDNWKRQDRLNYLMTVLFILPYETVQKSTKKVSFHQDKETNRTYFLVFEPDSQVFFLYEWREGMDIFKLLPLPKEKTLQLRIGIRELKCFEEGAHG